MNINRLLIFMLLILFTLACSSTKESTSDTNSSDQEVYVFDDVSDVTYVPEETTTTAVSHEAIEVTTAQKVEPPPPPAASPQVIEDNYVIQIGAFATREKAESLLKNAENKIKYQLNVSKSERNDFFVVQLSPFNSREAAEKARNELWNIPQFKDAFIVPK